MKQTYRIYTLYHNFIARYFRRFQLMPFSTKIKALILQKPTRNKSYEFWKNKRRGVKPLNCKKLQLQFLQTVRNCAWCHTRNTCTLGHTHTQTHTQSWSKALSCASYKLLRTWQVLRGRKRRDGGRERERKGRKEEIQLLHIQDYGASGGSRLNHT